MAFVDEITLRLKAGDGGDGITAWLHEKGREFMGPAGGDGGKGGEVYLRAVRDIGRLAAYRYGAVFSAGRGRTGEGKGRAGKDGADLEIEIPVGSVITNLKTGRVYEFLNEGDRIRALRGGKGGFGNKHFKGSRMVRPTRATKGARGENADFRVELRLIADAGIIGLPNAGKSSLLNALSAARAKVGDYPFTTLAPNLGVCEGHVLADIPGLIEGASAGRGLGDKFLRHIRRTRLLIHCVSLENDDVKKTYEIVREELGAYDKELLEKKEIVVLTKTDLADGARLRRAEKTLAHTGRQIFHTSILDSGAVRAFSVSLLRMLTG